MLLCAVETGSVRLEGGLISMSTKRGKIQSLEGTVNSASFVRKTCVPLRFSAASRLHRSAAFGKISQAKNSDVGCPRGVSVGLNSYLEE